MLHAEKLLAARKGMDITPYPSPKYATALTCLWAMYSPNFSGFSGHSQLNSSRKTCFQSMTLGKDYCNFKTRRGSTYM